MIGDFVGHQVELFQGGSYKLWEIRLRWEGLAMIGKDGFGQCFHKLFGRANGLLGIFLDGLFHPLNLAVDISPVYSLRHPLGSA